MSDGGKLPRISNGPRGSLLLETMRNFVIDAGRKGLDCVVDEVCHAPEIEDYRRGLQGCDVRFVKVTAPIEVIEQREKARGDRLIGLAREQSGHLHEGIDYDAEVDTSLSQPRECAVRLLRSLGG
jgi:chloramphenicol 3-O phosphotransferase